MIKGTTSAHIISLLKKFLTPKQRRSVREVTLDMAASMNDIAKTCFKMATRVIDRFHVQKLALTAIQDIRIKYRWAALELENNNYLQAKQNRRVYTPEVLPNGDTLKQLLARSRYLLFKPQSKWTQKQVTRAEILFKLYPDLEKAYQLVMKLNHIYEHAKTKQIAITKLAHWFREVEGSGFKNFATVMRSFQIHYDGSRTKVVCRSGSISLICPKKSKLGITYRRFKISTTRIITYTF